MAGLERNGGRFIDCGYVHASDEGGSSCGKIYIYMIIITSLFSFSFGDYM